MPHRVWYRMNLTCWSDHPLNDFESRITFAHNQRKNSFGAIKDFFAFGRTMITLFVFYPILWQIANKHFSDYSYAQSLVIPAAFSIMSEVIEFCLTSPLTAYYTFVIDAKFNKYSPGLYVWEQFKKLGLGLVLNSLFMWALVSIIDWAGPNAWRYMIGFIIGVVICVQILFPVTVAKCFNTFILVKFFRPCKVSRYNFNMRQSRYHSA